MKQITKINWTNVTCLQWDHVKYLYKWEERVWVVYRVWKFIQSYKDMVWIRHWEDTNIVHFEDVIELLR